MKLWKNLRTKTFKELKEHKKVVMFSIVITLSIIYLAIPFIISSYHKIPKYETTYNFIKLAPCEPEYVYEPKYENRTQMILNEHGMSARTRPVVVGSIQTNQTTGKLNCKNTEIQILLEDKFHCEPVVLSVSSISDDSVYLYNTRSESTSCVIIRKERVQR